MAATTRGRFILFEGLDRVGKTTQATLLYKHLINHGRPALYVKLPDRTTPIGKIIDSYLKKEYQMSVATAQLLFCANRYEVMPQYKKELDAGVDIVMDRYIYSAVAYGKANGLDTDWILSMERDLPLPDIVFYIDVDDSIIAQRTQGQSSELYENLDMQRKVRANFEQLAIPSKVVINGTGSVDDIHQRIVKRIG